MGKRFKLRLPRTVMTSRKFKRTKKKRKMERRKKFKMIR